MREREREKIGRREERELLTKHNFISGDNDIKLVGLRYDLPVGITIKQVILVDQPPAVSTAQSIIKWASIKDNSIQTVPD